MPLFKKFKTKEKASIGIWKVTESEDELKKLLGYDCRLIPGYPRITSESRRKEVLASRHLANLLLGELVFIKHHPNKKPYVVERNYEISISHSGSWVAFMFHNERNVAVDLEKLLPRLLDLHEKFVRPEELEFLKPLTKQKCGLVWSAKETLFKISEKSGLDFLKDLKIEPTEVNEEEGFVEATVQIKDEVKNHKVHYWYNPAFILTHTIV